MAKFDITWTQFKNLITVGNIPWSYFESDDVYDIYGVQGPIVYSARLIKATDVGDVSDFEENFKADVPLAIIPRTELDRQNLPTSLDGREVVRVDSRPKGFTSSFISRDDTLTGIGDGSPLIWDFSNSDNIVTDSLTFPVPSGYKRKRVEIGFSEKIYIKEGTIYFFNAPKGQYLDMYVVCKQGSVYEDSNGQIPGSAIGLDPTKTYTQATQDTPITHYVNTLFMQGTCPMGDELNTEGATEASLPTKAQGYVIWFEVTTPDSDNESNGVVQMEIYRKRTILLPGEDV